MANTDVKCYSEGNPLKGSLVKITDYVRLLRRSWPVLTVLVLVGTGAGAATALLTPPTYTSSTRAYVAVSSDGAASSTELVQGGSAAQQKVRSYVEVATSASVLAPVIDELQLDTTVVELSSRVRVANPINTVLIDVTVTDADPGGAARLADAVGNSLAAVVTDDLDAPVDGGPSLVRVEIVEPAATPTSPSSPSLPLDLGLGLTIGLAAGVFACLARGSLDRRLHDRTDVEAATTTPVLGVIAHDPLAAKRPLIVHDSPRTPRAEAFRTLRTNIQFLDLDGASRCFVVTSSVPGEGKTTTTANLALTLAETGASVAVVDGDLRRPRLAELLGLEGGAGLTDLLIGRVELDDVLQQWGRSSLSVLPAGPVPPNPSELVGSHGMASLLSELRQRFDYVLVDAPPVLAVTDAALLSRLAGGALVVIGSGRATSVELTRSLDALKQVDAAACGVILSRVPTREDGASYAYYGRGDAETASLSGR